MVFGVPAVCTARSCDVFRCLFVYPVWLVRYLRFLSVISSAWASFPDFLPSLQNVCQSFSEFRRLLRCANFMFRCFLPLRQLLVDANQLVFRREVDLDAPARALPDDTDLGAEGELQTIFRGARVDVDRLRSCGFTRRRDDIARLPDERLRLAHRQIACDDLARGLPLIRFARQREQRP